MAGELKIFGGRAHPALVQEICDYLNLEAGKVSAFNFSRTSSSSSRRAAPSTRT
jgi:phosphoribosylpyrophosphate synthetase